MAERLHKRLYVSLPVCERCHRVGKLPTYVPSSDKMAQFCTGPIEGKHPKTRMSSRLFVESRAKVKEEA